MQHAPKPIQFPPSPSDAWELKRWDESRRRLRLLEGAWREDLIKHMVLSIGITRTKAWGEPSLAVNPFANVCRELAVLYDSPPLVRNDQGNIEPLLEDIRLSGLWSMMQMVQTRVIGLREYLVRVSVTSTGEPIFRPVSPDMVVAWATPDKPDVPSVVWELRLRTLKNREEPVWTLDILDITDPEFPVYQVREALAGLELGEDLTVELLGSEQSGPAYPYRRTVSGKPFLPYVVYHAQKSGYKLWDPWSWIELVENTLDIAVMSQMVVHAFKDASWPQRYLIGVRPQGAGIIDADDARRSEIVSDPATILLLDTMENFTGQPSAGQFAVGADVAKLEETLSNFTSRVAQEAGVPPSDIQRLGGTARSGAAISLTNEGKRAAQRRFRETFADSDERLLSITASMVNAATGSTFPEGGYRVSYRELPLSPDELQAKDNHILTLVEAKLMSPVKAYMELNPGISKSQAIKELNEGLSPVDISGTISDMAEEIDSMIELLDTIPEEASREELSRGLLSIMQNLQALSSGNV